MNLEYFNNPPQGGDRSEGFLSLKGFACNHEILKLSILARGGGIHDHHIAYFVLSIEKLSPTFFWKSLFSIFLKTWIILFWKSTMQIFWFNFRAFHFSDHHFWKFRAFHFFVRFWSILWNARNAGIHNKSVVTINSIQICMVHPYFLFVWISEYFENQQYKFLDSIFAHLIFLIIIFEYFRAFHFFVQFVQFWPTQVSCDHQLHSNLLTISDLPHGRQMYCTRFTKLDTCHVMLGNNGSTK